MRRSLFNFACLVAAWLFSVVALVLAVAPAVGWLFDGYEIEAPTRGLVLVATLGSAIFSGALMLGVCVRSKRPMAWLSAYGGIWILVSLVLGTSFASGRSGLWVRASTETLLGPASAVLGTLLAARLAARFNRLRLKTSSD